MKEQPSALSLYIKSVLIGSAIIIPGISAGTLAFLFGIYSFTLNSIINLLSRNFWVSFCNLFWIGLGIFTGIVIFVLIMSYLILPFTPMTILIFSLFSGLLLGSITLIKSMIKKPIQGRKKAIAWLILIAGFALVLEIFILSPSKEELTTVYTKEDLTTLSFLTLLFFSNFIAGGFMLMPGISGSAILLSWGIYSPMIFALKNLFLLPILFVGLGNLIGIFFWSGFITYLLKNHNTLTLFLITGLILGSAAQVTFLSISLIDSPIAIILYSIGFLGGLKLSLLFSQITKKSKFRL